MQKPAGAALVVFLAACGSAPDAGKSKGAAAADVSPEARDAGAIADLQASPQWRRPNCRWLESGAHVLAYAQETALLRAAHDLGYIEMKEVGTDNRTGAPEPAWSIELTGEGKTATADCPPQSTDKVFGVPVSRRQFISATHAGQDNRGRTVYDVEFEWVPTPLGERVKGGLTGKMAVEEGTYPAKAFMSNKPGAPGAHGWVVETLVDFSTKRIR